MAADGLEGGQLGKSFVKFSFIFLDRPSIPGNSMNFRVSRVAIFVTFSFCPSLPSFHPLLPVFLSLSLSLSLCLSLIALDSLTFLQPSTNDFMVVKMTSYTSKGSNNDNQCGQIGWFITLWVNFQSPWQQLFCLKCQHILGIFCKFVKFFHFTIKILFGQLFTGHTDDNNFYLLYLAELFDVFVWLLLFYLLLRLIGIGSVLASKFSSATGNSNFVIYITRTSREEIWNILYWRPSQ